MSTKLYTSSVVPKLIEGISPEVNLEQQDSGVLMTVTTKSGSKSAMIPKGETGAPGTQGETGTGIQSTVLNQDYTLTINYTDGTSTTTSSIRGEQGAQGIQGIQGPKGDTGAKGDQGIQGVKGDKGDKGDTGATGAQGPKGDTGLTGATPQLSIGTVETLDPGDDATVTISGTTDAPVLNFGIPQGDPGEVTQADLNAAVAGIEQTIGTVPTGKTVQGQVDELYTGKADVIVSSADPAPIVSFPDGADGMPVKTLNVSIEPVQDLHGQDAPYPAGGGKNLLPLTTANLKALNTTGSWDGNVYTEAGVSYTVQEDNAGNVIGINANGTASGNSFFRLVANATVTDGSYTLNGCPTGGNGETYCQYVYTNTGYYDTGEGVTTSISSTFSCNIRIFGGYTVSNKTFTPMLRLSSVSDATFAPYSNVCPISGWTGANVQRTGKNLLHNKIYKENSYRIQLGISSMSEYVHLKAGTYKLSYGVKSGVTGTSLFWKKRDEQSGHESSSITLQGDADLRIWIFKEGIETTDILWWQLEPGSTATAYEPYSGETIEYEFPSSAGTVYGGTLTIHQDGSGALVVDRAMVTVSETTGTLTSNGKTAITTRALYTPSVEKLPGQHNFISDKFAISNVDDFVGKMSGRAATGSVEFHLPPTVENSGPAVRAWFAENPTQLCYKLATNVTYQLTNQQVLSLLKGNNNLWADTGNVTLEYPADTKLYIDGKIAELQALILENISNS